MVTSVWIVCADIFDIGFEDDDDDDDGGDTVAADADEGGDCDNDDEVGGGGQGRCQCEGLPADWDNWETAT